MSLSWARGRPEKSVVPLHMGGTIRPAIAEREAEPRGQSTTTTVQIRCSELIDLVKALSKQKTSVCVYYEEGNVFLI